MLGTPGGTANFDHPNAHPAGIGVTAQLDKGKGEYVLNGRKYWPCNSGGWDLKGADVNVVIVRTAPSKDVMLRARGLAGISRELLVLLTYGFASFLIALRLFRYGDRLDV